MSTERDTHFRGFAKLLWDELGKLPDFTEYPTYDDEKKTPMLIDEAAKNLIAQRAYDLVIHAVDESNYLECIEEFQSGLTLEKVVSDIRDMTEWPNPE